MSTKIDWADETINPLGWGCYGPGGTPEDPRPCSYCYARRFAVRNTRGCDLCAQFIPHWHPEQLDGPHYWRKPRRIFVQSMGDLFHPYTPQEHIECILAMAKALPRHIFQFLTKNPKRLKDFKPWPSNCWLGTTVTNQADMDERGPELVKVDASVRFVSHEPLLGEIVVKKYLFGRSEGEVYWSNYRTYLDKIAWAIIGAMTGPGAVKPKPEWVQTLIDQYRAAGVPIFCKDNLHGLPGTKGLVQEWPRV